MDGWNALWTSGDDPGNASLRTDRWRYTRYTDGSEELCNHREDSGEWTNLARMGKHARQKESLYEMLAPFLKRRPSE